MEDIFERIMEYKQKLLIGIPLVLLLIGMVVFFQRSSSQNQEQLLMENAVGQVSEEATSTFQEATSEEMESELVVDVKGAVRQPGIYTLESGSRVNDAIQAAGGFSEQADPTSINLAKKVTDEHVIYVASKEENRSIVSNVAATEEQTGHAEKVNLNTATESELRTISGVGAKRAADIIAYREANGKFKSVDDLHHVSGIGDKMMESMRPYVTVD